MAKIIIFLLLIAPGFAIAAPAVSVKSQNAQAETKNKTDVYRTIAGELLKDCTGAGKAVAVAGFSYSDSRDSRDGGVVAERITTELVKSKKFKVIERKEIEKVFEELKLQRSGAINPDSAKEIGKMLGADWVVVGTLTELPDKHLELNTRLVSVESGEIINAANARLKKDWLEQYKKMLNEQNKAIEKNTKDAKAFYERGVINTDLTEYDNAIAAFSIALTINPTYMEAYRGRGLAYHNKGENDKAIEDLSKAIEIGPKNADAYNYRGFAYGMKGEYDKAIEDYSSAIAINPKYEDAYIARGRNYTLKGDYDKAIGNYSELIAINPKDALSYSLRGYVYQKKGEVDKAEADFKKSSSLLIEEYSNAIEVNPKDAEAYLKRGSAYADKGEYDKAISDFTKATEIKPDFLEA